jgi:hypothetical protein
MPNYTVNGKSYFFGTEIGQEAAEAKVKELFGGGGSKGEDKYSYENPEDEGVLQEITEGVGSGLIAIPQGIAELGASVIDLAAGTNYSEAVTKAGNALRDALDIDPTGVAGKLTEGLTQFAIPGIAAASAVSKMGRLAKIARGQPQLRGKQSVFDKFRGKRRGKEVGSELGIAPKGRELKLTKSQKFGEATRQIAAAGLTDAIVSTDGTQTLADFFEGGPSQTKKTFGLEGRELAAAKIYNKVMHGLEGSVFAGILPPVLGAAIGGTAKLGARTTREVGLGTAGAGVGAGYEIIGSAIDGELPEVGDLLESAAIGVGVGVGAGVGSRAVGAGADVIGGAIQRGEDRYLRGESINTLDKAVTRAVAAFRYRSFLDPKTARLKSLVNPAVEGDIKIAEKQLKDIDKQIKLALKDEDYMSSPNYTKEKLINNFMDVLEGSKYEDLQIPKYLYDAYAKAKTSIDRLSERIKDSSIVRGLPEEIATSEIMKGTLTKQAFIDLVNNNINEGGYLSRLYQIFNDDTFKLADDVRATLVDQIENGKGVDIKHVQRFLQDEQGSYPIDDTFVTDWTAGNVKLTPSQAERYIDNVTEYYKGLKNSKPKSSTGISIPVVRLNPGVVNKPQVDNEIIKAIMGEIKTPKEAYIHTIAELSNFIAADAFYTGFKQSADTSIIGTAARNASSVANGRKGDETPLFINTNAEMQARLDEINQARLEANPGATIANGGLYRLLDQVPDGEKQIQAILERVRTRGGKLDYVVLGRDAEAGGGQGGTASRSAYGDMYGYAIPRPMFDAMTNVVNANHSPVVDFMRTFYGPLLQLKGVSQYAKTILSPITQVRNVTSAAMFALANGNVGKGAGVWQSVDLVLRDLIDKDLKIKGTDFGLNDEVLDFLVDLQKRGVIGSSAQLREIQANLKKGLGYRDTGPTGEAIQRYTKNDSQGIVSTVQTEMPGSLRGTLNAPKKIKDVKGADTDSFSASVFAAGRNSQLNNLAGWAYGKGKNGALAFLDKAEGLYKGGDDIWKIYNYTFELNKLRNARTKMMNDGGGAIAGETRFSKFVNRTEDESIDEAMKRYAADNVRNLVPNYELVPDVIKGLRMLPFGNFIAFPAEILRTGFNILNTSAKELASSDVAIREIGMKRLMGGLTAFGVAGDGLQRFAQKLTDTSDEELNAANRLAATWQRNSQFIPVGRDKNGNFEYIDFSHTNPYDLLSRGFRTMLKTYQDSSRLGKSYTETAGDIAYDSLTEYLQPFLDQSMIFAALQDTLKKSVGGRGGETATGSKVYREGDSPSVAWEKSLIHVFNTLMPNAIPIRVPIGADLGIAGGNFPNGVKSVEMGRFARGVFSSDTAEPSTGREYDTGSELFRAFTGVNTQVIDNDKIAYFKAQEFKSSRSDAASVFNDSVNRDIADDEQILTAYERADDSRLNAFKLLAKNADDLMTLGMSRSDLRKQFKKAGLGNEETSSILNDRYIPFTPSKTKIDEARRKGIFIPQGALNSLRSLRRGMSLREEEPLFGLQGNENTDQLMNLFSSPKPVNKPINKSNVVAPITQQETINIDQNINNIMQNSFNIKSNPLTRVSPTVLGSNPTDIAKNMDIARRTG